MKTIRESTSLGRERVPVLVEGAWASAAPGERASRRRSRDTLNLTSNRDTESSPCGVSSVADVVVGAEPGGFGPARGARGRAPAGRAARERPSAHGGGGAGRGRSTARDSHPRHPALVHEAEVVRAGRFRYNVLHLRHGLGSGRS